MNVKFGDLVLLGRFRGDKLVHITLDPFEPLKFLISSIFFAEPGYTLGAEMRVQTQGDDANEHYHSRYNRKEATGDDKFVENVIWKKSDVLFVAVNIPGGSNNGTDVWYGAPTMSNEQAREVTERTGAALRWLKEAYQQAKASNAKAMVIQIQADMWDLDGNPVSHLSNYKDYVDLIATYTKAFGKPVLLLNGDSHIYRSDNPLVQGATCYTEDASCTNDAYASHGNGYNVPNFHRITVHGSTFPMEWLKLNIDTNINAPVTNTTFGPFSWERVIAATAP